MSKLKKAAIAIGAVYVGLSALTITGLVLIARAFLNKKSDFGELQKLGTQLQTFPSVKIHRLDFTGLTLRVDVLLKNPTLNGFKMSNPFISVEYQGTAIGSSQPKGGSISIAPTSQVQLDAVYLSFPILQMLSVVSGLVKSLNSGAAVKLNVITRCQVDPMWRVDANGNWLPLKDYGVRQLRAIAYEQKQEVNLKKARD